MSIPRKNILSLNTAVELAINNAQYQVEQLGANEKLTEACLLLQKAKDLVGEYIDQKIKDCNITD